MNAYSIWADKSADIGRRFQNTMNTVGNIGAGIAQSVQALRDAEAASQYSKGLVAIEDRDSQFNREVPTRTWETNLDPEDANYKPGDYTARHDGQVSGDPNEAPSAARLKLGEIPFEKLEETYDAHYQSTKRYIETTTTNEKARESLLIALDQKRTANLNQLYELWFTEKAQVMIADSDRNISFFKAQEADPEQKLTRIRQQLDMDIDARIRQSGDANIYFSKVQNEVYSSHYMNGALKIADATNNNLDRVDEWIDQRTPFWNNQPERRQALKAEVRRQVAWERQETLRVQNELHDHLKDSYNGLIANNVDSREGLLNIRQHLIAAKDEFGMFDGTRLQFIDDIDRRLAAQDAAAPTDKEALENRWETNLQKMDSIVMDMIANGESMGTVLRFIDMFAVERDDDGKWRKDNIDPLKYKDRRADYSDVTKYETYKSAFGVLEGRIKDNKLSNTAAEELKSLWLQEFKKHPDATLEETREIAKTFGEEIQQKELRMNIRRGAGYLGIPLNQVVREEEALREVQEDLWDWRSQRNEDSKQYLTELTKWWYDTAKQEFPNINLVRAATDWSGDLGYEGMPIFYDDKGQAYRFYFHKDSRDNYENNATLQRFTQLPADRYNPEETWKWLDVTANE